MTSTYAYIIVNTTNSSSFLSGYINVSNNLITNFYDYSQNNQDILVIDGLDGENHIFNSTGPNYFTFGGVNINNSNTNVYNLISNYITTNNLTTSVSSYFMNLYFTSTTPSLFTMEIYNNTTGARYTVYTNYIITISPILYPTPLCYNEDSLILTLTNGIEEYREIKDLKKGDIIKVYPNIYKKIKLIGSNILKNDSSINTMYIYKKKTNNLLIRDLIVTGLHFVEYDNNSNYNDITLLDNIAMIPAYKSSLFTKINNDKYYTYYHLVLESEIDKHYVIWVNGILSESTNNHYFKNSLLLNKE